MTELAGRGRQIGPTHVVYSMIRIVPVTTPDSSVFGMLPFFGAELARVAVLVAFPALTLWLPEVLGG